MKEDEGQNLAGYAIAVASVALATAIRWTLLNVYDAHTPLALYYLAILVAVRFGGYRAAWLALALGVLPQIYFRMHLANHEITVDRNWHTVIGVYLFIGSTFILLTKAQVVARKGAELDTARSLEQRRQLEHEIAERKGFERELRQRHTQLEMALQAGQLGTWAWEIATNRVQWSPTNEAIHGFLPGTFAGTFEDAVSRIDPADRRPIHERLKQYSVDGQSHRLAYRVIWPDGSVHWVEGLGQMFFNELGEPLRMLGVCADITDRKRAEAALREAEERFRLLALQAPVGIVQSNAEGNTFFVNSKWCEIAGAAPDEVMGVGWHNLFHPDDRERVLSEWQAAIDSGSPSFTAEFRFLHKNGSLRWVSACATLLRDAQGNDLGQIGTLLDITERKLADEALRESRGKLQTILDNTPAVIYLKDWQGRLMLVNKRFRDLFHVTQEEVAGKVCGEVFPAAMAEQISANDQRVREAGTPLIFEEIVGQEDGLHTYLSVRFPIYNSAGTGHALGGISTDITERKRASEALAGEREYLRHTIAVQDQERQLIAYNIHDGLVQHATAALMHLEGIRHHPAAVDLAGQIDGVLELQRKTVAEGRRIMNGIRTPVLDDWGVVPALKQLIDEEERAHIQVKFINDSELGRLAPNIEEALFRIAQEALTNAHKHSQTKRIEIELKRIESRILLTVRDWGVGFDRRQKTKGVHGLKTMYERAAIAGGRCTIESQPGNGTIVIVELPFLPRG